MIRYLAPLEGITGYIFRRAWAECFGGADKAFTPFLSPNQNKRFLSKEREDVLPEHNQNMNTVPQILTNRADYFLWTVKELEQQGYREFNLNLGCPSMTVVSKKRGSGLLPYPEDVDRLLEGIFQGTDLRVSVKTRLGRFRPEEFRDLLPVFNRYPLAELIVHPRIQLDMYQNQPDWDWFSYALEYSENPICYNGDLISPEDEEMLLERFPDCHRIMYGRGVLKNPALLRQLSGGERLQPEEFRKFHNKIYRDYQEEMSGDMPVLFKMKELWAYWAEVFPDPEQVRKKIRKVKSCREYEAVVETLDLSSILQK